MKKGPEKIKFVNGEMYRYSVYDIMDGYDPILKQTLQPFDFTNPPMDTKLLASSLIETMLQNNGVGLAASQIGLPYRVFAMGAGEYILACFNPEIIESSGNDNFKEGCLSFPGLYLEIPRASSVTVKYYDFTGAVQNQTFTGLTAKIFQHELDHLNGVVFTSRISPIKLELAKRKIKTNLKKLKAQNLARVKAPVENTAAKLPDYQPVLPPPISQNTVENQVFTIEAPSDLVFSVAGK